MQITGRNIFDQVVTTLDAEADFFVVSIQSVIKLIFFLDAFFHFPFFVFRFPLSL